MKTAIHCPTEELWNKVQEKLFAEGKEWSTTGKGKYNDWSCYRDGSCITNEPKFCYASKDYYIRGGYTVIPAQEFLMNAEEQIEKELKDQRAKVAELESRLAAAKKEKEIDTGDYVVALRSSGGAFTKDRVYKVRFNHHPNFFDDIGIERDDFGSDDNGWGKKNFRKATQDEILSHLVAEAAKKGFVVGALVKDESGGEWKIDDFYVLQDRKDLRASYNCLKALEKERFPLCARGSGYSSPVDSLELISNITIEVDDQKYTAEFKENVVKFGCAEISKALFKDIARLLSHDYAGNRGVESVTIGKDVFTKELISKIVEKL